MLTRILRDLAVTFTLCLGERVLERFLFPGLHRVPGRMVTTDPTRLDAMSTLIAEALGLFALVWIFNGTLYAISFLIRRPLRPAVPTLIAALIVVLIFASAATQWSAMPTPPVQ